jgi:hypothetical protein
MVRVESLRVASSKREQQTTETKGASAYNHTQQTMKRRSTVAANKVRQQSR